MVEKLHQRNKLGHDVRTMFTLRDQNLLKNIFLLLLLLLGGPTVSIGAEMRTLEIEFSFTAPTDPAQQVLGYRLYNEGEQVCDSNDHNTNKITCDIFTEDGTFIFTLAAYYFDGTESLLSPSFPFTINSTSVPSQGSDKTYYFVDKTYYLDAKLAQLQTVAPGTWDNYTSEQLETLLASHGLTAESHYMKYGYNEGLEPNSFFNHGEYIIAKGAQLYQIGAYNSIGEGVAAFQAAWPYDVYQHYLLFGAAEGINPSNSFDESQYLADELSLLQERDPEWLGGTIDELREVLASYGMTVLDHYFNYGKDEGLIVVPVPADQRVEQ